MYWLSLLFFFCFCFFEISLAEKNHSLYEIFPLMNNGMNLRDHCSEPLL